MYLEFTKKHYYKKTLLFIVLVIISFTSCKEIEVNDNQETSSGSTTGLQIKKIKKLENPYSISNIQKAYSALKEEGIMRAGLNFDATHLYVRFLPRDSTELETLFRDTTLTLFSHPLDYELTEGEKYVDITLIGNNFTWLYTRVPVGYISPIGQYEVIEQLYLPTLIDYDIKSAKSHKLSSKLSDEWWSVLENKSLEITGNIDSTQDNQKGRKRWTPKATIRVKDNVTNVYVPLQGVEVRARWWFNWEKGFTDANGRATMSGTFNGKLNWSIVWDSHDWDIRSGFYGQAFYNGPSGCKSDWNLDIEVGGKSFVYGHVHRACYNYWNNKLGLKKPFIDNFWKQKIKIGVYDKAGRSYFGSASRWLFGSPVVIYEMESDGSPRTASRIYNTTIHELAHVSHWEMDHSDFYNSDDRIVEGYAVGIAYVFSAQVYSLSQIPHGDFQNSEFSVLTGHYEKKYTPLVIDLIDNYNQRIRGITFPNDNVSGYTISQIENAIKGAKTLEHWRNNLKNMYDNPTEDKLDELFNNYINWK